MARPTFARIDLDAVMQNICAIKRLTGEKKICAAVKADGYGHGAGAVAHAMSAAGADMFGVAMTEEAAYLRRAGITEPIILLTTVPAEDIDIILKLDIKACIADDGFAEELSAAALRKGIRAGVHINIDTGMGRIGLPHESAASTVLQVNRLPGLNVEGIFTHLACSDNSEVSQHQLHIFNRVINRLKAAGMPIPLLHVANSTATLKMPETHMQCVRPGLILYGLHPPNADTRSIKLRPALSLHTRVVFCKRVPAGTKLGYGHTFTTERESVIATIPLGYHDGYVRQYSNNGEVLIRGKRAPVVGRVCMDQTLVDVTDVPGIETGDEVVVYGTQGKGRITVEEMAHRLDRIPYELTCAVGARVRRRYVLNGITVGETPVGSLIPPDVISCICASPMAVPNHRKAAV